MDKVVRRRVGHRFDIRAITTHVHQIEVTADPVHWLTRMLWWCSGAHTDFLRSCPTESAKHASVGGAVLTTGILACCSGGFAVFTMLGQHGSAFAPAMLVGIIWGFVIFNLDRSIVCSMRKYEEGSGWQNLWRTWRPAIPRLLLAAMIGTTVAKPLELALFDTEIRVQVGLNRDVDVAKKSQSLRNSVADKLKDLTDKITALKDTVAAKEAALSRRRSEFNAEIDGTGGSGRYGYDVVARKKESEMADALADYNRSSADAAPDLEKLQKERDDLIGGLDPAVERVRNADVGFLDRMRALGDLSDQDRSVALASWAIMILVTLVEIIPIIVKLLSPYGPYDASLTSRESIEIHIARKRAESAMDIASHHYAEATKTEMEVEDVLQAESLRVRSAGMRAEWRAWVLERAAGHAPTFMEFLKRLVRDLLFNREP